MGNALKVPPPPDLSFEENNRPIWQRWFRLLADGVNAPPSLGPSTITLTGSPFVYRWTGSGTASIALDGNLTTKVEFSRNGVTYYTCGTAAGMYTLSQGDFIRITYTGAGPAVTLIPR